MADFDTGRLIYLILLLAMVGGWFLLQARGEGMNKTLQQAAIWGLIFLGTVAGIGLWEDIKRTTTGGQISLNTTDQIIVPRNGDGHYYLTLDINKTPVRFVVDTGATDMVLTQRDAARVGLDPDTLTYAGRAGTANGEVRTAYVRLDEVVLGSVTDTDVAAVVNQGQMDGSLLGMGYLQRWGRFEIAQGELILTR